MSLGLWTARRFKSIPKTPAKDTESGPRVSWRWELAFSGEGKSHKLNRKAGPMRQGSNPKRLRGRNNGRKNTNPRSQSFESNGPEVKVRGNAQQVVEKYLALARDATTSGDRITAESYFQHAEHYYRVMTANGGFEGRETQPRQQDVSYDAKSDAGDPAVGAAPVTNGANDPAPDPASAPQPDSDADQDVQAAQAE